MKHILTLLIILPLCFGEAQDVRVNKSAIKEIIGVQEQIKKDLIKEYNSNFDTLRTMQRESIRKLPSRSEIRYVKVYKTVPVYVPVIDTVNFTKVFNDTLDEIRFDPIESIPVKKKKISLFKRIFKIK